MGKDEETALCVRRKVAVFGENHILDETDELIKIFVTSIETAVRPPRQARDFQQAHGPERSRGVRKNRNSKQMKLNYGAKRHHYQ
jgi:hypothetical protein